MQKSFVDISRTAKWCTGRDCQYIVEQPSGEAVDVTCECGNFFCFGCLKQGHMPIDCELLQAWQDRIA